MSVKPTNIPKCHLRQSADSAGNFSRHGKLGEVTENIRTFALPYESKPYTFKMSFEYDSWNRMQRMTYPDGEVVSYGYNRGGMLYSIYGQKDGFYYPYVNHINYNQFEQKDSVLYGNGSVVTYQYDTLMRLKHLRSYTGTTPAELMQDITYQYDSVSNILQIKNQAQMLSNGLGGAYVSNYTYDHLYRLSAANGNWDNGTLYNTFSVNMGYNLNGRIYKKNIQADILDYHGNVTTKRYQNTYSYNSTHNTLQMVDDAISGQRQYFSWDHNGNMIEQMDREDCIRKLCWSEENRLMGVADCNYASLYQYDANGERTYKLTGQYSYQNINGRYFPYAMLESPTLYASPYVVCTPKGYTKHYYAESERVASKIGNGCLRDLCKSLNTNTDFNREDEPVNPYLIDCGEVNEVFKRKLEHNNLYGNAIMECTSAGNFIVGSKLGNIYERIGCINEKEKECYWYHPDHLGSSSWITFSDGSAVQHLHYLPWGEDFVDQRSTSWNAMHAFSSKERDVETGLSYFGSRYYSSDLSVWLSVDPMSDKYPSMSPYNYCANNPVKLVDPNGEDWFLPENSTTPQWDENVTQDNLPKGATYLGTRVNGPDLENPGYYFQGDEYGVVTRTRQKEVVIKNPASFSAPWMDFAKSQIGVKEVPNESNSGPEVDKFLAAAGGKPGQPWCAAFVHWSLNQSGFAGAGTAGQNYLSFGDPVSKENPYYGSIACFKTGHVGFYAGKTENGNYIIVHGNWGGAVRESRNINPDEIKCFRFPSVRTK